MIVRKQKRADTSIKPVEYIRRYIMRMSQKKFAKAAGVSQGTVSKWETGRKVPDMVALELIRLNGRRYGGARWDDSLLFAVPPTDPGNPRRKMKWQRRV